MTETNEKSSALEKRIKKHIIGKPHRFTAVAPLGFEETLAEELKYIGVECSPDISNGTCAEGSKASGIKVAGDGKVEFAAKITEAWKAVAYSRIANRILMEIDSFKAENFGQLEKHTAEIPWELYLGEKVETRDESNTGLVLHTNCKHSRLYHSDAVEERVRKIVEEKCSANTQQVQQHLYINLLDDRCTIWLDLAGEELYKRGHERFVAEAPLKETIAAAMIFEASKIAGTPAAIVDTMAGSGTFSLEAAYIANGLIPGKCRDFALKHQPAFKEGTWNFILKRAKPQSEPSERLSSKRCDLTIITSDICKRPIDIIKHNIESSPLKDIYASAGENAIAKIDPQLKDFFSYTIEDFHEKAVILLNPPYGKRLDFDAPKLYKMIGEKLNEWGHDAHAKSAILVVAILAPKDCTANLLKECPTLDPRNNPAAKLIETSHGGFGLNAFFAQI